MSTRVVVTGMGAMTPIGMSVAQTWEAMKAGKSGVRANTWFDTTDYPCKIVADIKDFDPSKFMDSKEARKQDRFSQLCVGAGLEALADAGIKTGETVDPTRIGIVLGNGIGGIMSLEEGYENLYTKGPRRIPLLTIPKMISNLGPGNLAIAVNAQGPCYAVVTACSSGTDAMSSAAALIEKGICDVVVTGGAEAPISKMAVGGFCLLHAVSTKYNETPEKASRPFDKDRDGFVLGEGAGILVFESLEHAQKRGAKIYAELGGVGLSCDANHITAPHPEGRGAMAAMRMALNLAGLKPEDINYINAHGTSTPINDPTETKAIKGVFGEHAYKLKVSSTKSMTGHMIGGTGGVEAIACILAIRDQWVPPTINLDTPDPECDLDYVPKVGQKHVVNATMSNTLGFGGHNGVVVFKKFVK